MHPALGAEMHFCTKMVQQSDDSQCVKVKPACHCYSPSVDALGLSKSLARLPLHLLHAKHVVMALLYAV